MIHGKLSIPMAIEKPVTINNSQIGRVIQVGSLEDEDNFGNDIPQPDDSYVRTSDHQPSVVSPSTRPLSSSLSTSLTDRRTELIQRRASVFTTPPPNASNLPHADLSQATHNPVYVPRSSSDSPQSPPPARNTSVLQTLEVSAAEKVAGKPLSPATQVKTQLHTQVKTQLQSIFSPLSRKPPEENKETSPVASDSQLSRQSSVDEGPSSMDSKSKRKSSGGKSSAIKNKIQMRKMMKEANKMEIPSGVLSDPDNEMDNDSVEEKQDSEPIYDSERSSNNKKKTNLIGPMTVQPPPMAQLTPETARKMKDWNARFSNLKHSFDPGSDKEDDTSRSPSMQRHNLVEASDCEDPRGRARARDKGSIGQRSKSEHGGVRQNSGPTVLVEEYLQTKDDKNKNNSIIAKRASSHPEKDKSPGVRRIGQDTDDEYMQYLYSVAAYRQSNPNPKPFRPITSRSDAIGAPLRKLSADQPGDWEENEVGDGCFGAGGGSLSASGAGQPPIRQQSFCYNPQVSTSCLPGHI